MRALLLAVVVLVGLPRPGGAEQRADGPLDGSAKSGTLDLILSHWSIRERQFSHGRILWRLERQNRSSTFGGLIPIPDGSTDPAPHSVFTFSEGTYRLESRCVAPIYAERSGGWLSPRVMIKRRDPEAEFAYAIQHRFENAAPVQELQPYVAVANTDGQLHHWAATSDSASIAIKTGSHGVSRNFYNASRPHALPHWPIEAGLLDAIQLAIHPRPIQDDPEGTSLRILDDRPTVDGVACFVLEEPLDNAAEGGGRQRRLWIDPEKGYLVMRCILRGTDGLPQGQFDFSYDLDASGEWVPQQVIVLQFDHGDRRIQLVPQDDPYDQICLRLLDFDRTDSVSASDLTVSLPGGTLLLDEATSAQLRIGKAGEAHAIVLDSQIQHFPLVFLANEAYLAVGRPGTVLLLAMAIAVLLAWAASKRRRRAEHPPRDDPELTKDS